MKYIPHKALATKAEFQAAMKLPLDEKLKWWNERVKHARASKPN